MDKLIIEGGLPLSGDIAVSGSKNAALPILFACLLAKGEVTLTNVPNLQDIRTTLKLLDLLGCKTKFDGQCVTSRVETLSSEAPYELVKTMRASVLCLGPLLALLGEAVVALPGGCAIGARPIDQHLKALGKMGAEFELTRGNVYGKCDGLKGAHITFDFPTVGATENLLMAAAIADGRTVLENSAREPEVQDLANFLNAMGANITGQGSSVITIEGVPELLGGTYKVMPDRIEAGTFMAAVAAAGGAVTLKDCPSKELDAVIHKFQDMGLVVEGRGEDVFVAKPGPLKGVEITTQPYPGFPTDMQAQFMAVMCVSQGMGTIEEKIFENRFMHVLELVRLGADIRLKGHTAMVCGVEGLVGAPVMGSDLRASASLVIAGLAAEGTTEVQRIYHLDRGYERLEEKLTGVGARIRRVSE